MRAVIYVRVSTDSQEKDGTSLETQQRACMEYAEAAGWQVVECVPDVSSGANLEREGIERVRLLLRGGLVDVVLAHAVDRLSRNQNHIGILLDEVQKAGAQLELVTERFEDTAVGRFILAARAFSAEVEREKILERTMRGKAERARSGRLPQGTGRGLYGYHYNQALGVRETDEYQATVVRRIFQRYAETQSFSMVSGELNEAKIPAQAGGRWYPLTVRWVLSTESYTGRTYYRRTKRVKSHNGRNGSGPRSRVVLRPEEEWIEVDGCTPRIVDEAMWRRVQDILADPERISRRPTGRYYALSSRTRCGLCGSAMVGQTLAAKGKPYRYYRCRHAYDKNTGHSCTARYIRCERLEDTVWKEVERVLTNPGVILHELQRQAREKVDASEVGRLESALAELKERERRLVHLYTLGDVREETLRNESAGIASQRMVLEEQLGSLRRQALPFVGDLDQERLSSICAAVAGWLDRAGEPEKALVLEALQIGVVATVGEARISGVLPTEFPSFLADEPTSDEPTSEFSDLTEHPVIPFDRAFNLAA